MDLLKELNFENAVKFILFVLALFFTDYIKETVHTFTVWLGFKSNLALALYRDKNIDEALAAFVSRQDCVAAAIITKISNGGGIPKEGSPLNSMITNPIDKRIEWPLTEASPYVRDVIAQVYAQRGKGLVVPIEQVPIGDPSYSYLHKQKGVKGLKLQFLKEKSKCWFILSVRFTCEVEEYYDDLKLREDIRFTVNQLKKFIR